MWRKHADHEITSSSRADEAEKWCYHGRQRLEIRGDALTEMSGKKVVNDCICYFFLCCVQTPDKKKRNGGKDYLESIMAEEGSMMAA